MTNDEYNAKEFGQVQSTMEACVQGIADLKKLLADHAKNTRDNIHELYEKSGDLGEIKILLKANAEMTRKSIRVLSSKMETMSEKQEDIVKELAEKAQDKELKALRSDIDKASGSLSAFKWIAGIGGGGGIFAIIKALGGLK